MLILIKIFLIIVLAVSCVKDFSALKKSKLYDLTPENIDKYFINVPVKLYPFIPKNKQFRVVDVGVSRVVASYNNEELMDMTLVLSYNMESMKDFKKKDRKLFYENALIHEMMHMVHLKNNIITNYYVIETVRQMKKDIRERVLNNKNLYKTNFINLVQSCYSKYSRAECTLWVSWYTDILNCATNNTFYHKDVFKTRDDTYAQGNLNQTYCELFANSMLLEFKDNPIMNTVDKGLVKILKRYNKIFISLIKKNEKQTK
jgi:hypothetical protein